MLILFDIFLVYHSISAGEKHNVLGFRLELCRVCSKSVENWRRDDAEPFSARMQDGCVCGGPFHFSAPRRRLVPCSAVGTRDLFRSPSFIRLVSGLKETACGCW